MLTTLHDEGIVPCTYGVADCLYGTSPEFLEGLDRQVNLVSMVASPMGSVDQELLLRNADLVTANCLVRQQIRGRPCLTDGQRKTLAQLGKRLGTPALAEVATLGKPDTILAWHRTLIAKKFDGSQHREAPGRPPMGAGKTGRAGAIWRP